LIWACYFWDNRKFRHWEVLSAILFTLAIYSYPPMRIQGPCVMGILLWISIRTRRFVWRKGFVFSATVMLLSWPLLQRMHDPNFTYRGMTLAIWQPDRVQSHKGLWPSFFYLTRATLDNFAVHFRPSFLFISGDENVRHSTQFLGELSVVDALALMLGLLLLIKPPGGKSYLPRAPSSEHYFLFSIAGVLLGILPAALTWEGTPHALRALGAWPFFCLVGGGCLALAEQRWAFTRLAVLSLGAVHAVAMLTVYFRAYAGIAQEAFSVPVFDSAALAMQRDDVGKGKVARASPEAMRVFLIQHHNYDCTSSQLAVSRWIDQSVAAEH
jgi:hypothetical protein